MKTLGYVAAVLSLGASCVAVAAPNAVADVMATPPLRNVRLKGAPAEKMHDLFRARLTGDFAKKYVFGEARRAFEFRDDDRKGHGGIWRGEFWGKNMLSAARVADYLNDPAYTAWIAEECHRMIALQDPDGYLGSYADKELEFAFNYLKYLGTSTMSPEEVKKYLYDIAVDFSAFSSGERTYVSLSGLAENMEEAMKFMETLISDAQPNPDALEMLKVNALQERANAKSSQDENSYRLQYYAMYGPQNPMTAGLSNSGIMALEDGRLLEKIHHIFESEHTVLYYGPMEEGEFVAKVNEIHNVPEQFKPVVKGNPFQYTKTQKNTVLLAPYDANQSVLYSISSRGDKFEAEKAPVTTLYNEYFGGGMNSIVFQEMREARGLAYSAGAVYRQPSDLEHTEVFLDMIMTQNDKLVDALTAFDEIINNIPQSQKAFDIAKENIISNLRTQRTVKSNVLWSYLSAQKLGLDYDINQLVYDKVKDLTLEDVVKFQQENVKDRVYTIGILGRLSDFDMNGLSQFGEIKKISTEELFGY